MAAALAQSGANVVINGRSEAACQRAVADIGPTPGRVAYVVGRIEDEPTAAALVATCAEMFGPVRFVVNNAGITRDKSLMKMGVDEFDDVVAVHLRGSWLLCRAAARAMRHAGGSILNVTSGSALYGLVGQSNYAAAKGGIIALTRALSVELARYTIRVNALYPVALTDMTAPVLELAGGHDGPRCSVIPPMSRNSLRRWRSRPRPRSRVRCWPSTAPASRCGVTPTSSTTSATRLPGPGPRYSCARP
jgi:3-oxoacyl-[acyl-carrier protein] reductase